MNLSEFKKAFKKIKQMGWVQSMRKGPTGIGQTLERLINIHEYGNTSLNEVIANQ